MCSIAKFNARLTYKTFEERLRPSNTGCAVYSHAKTCARSPINAKVVLSCPSLDKCNRCLRECHVLDDQMCYSSNKNCRYTLLLAIAYMESPVHGWEVVVCTLVAHVLVSLVLVCSKLPSRDGCQIEFDIEQPSCSGHVLLCLFWHLRDSLGSHAIAKFSSRLPVVSLACPFQFCRALLCTPKPNLALDGPLFHNYALA